MSNVVFFSNVEHEFVKNLGIFRMERVCEWGGELCDAKIQDFFSWGSPSLVQNFD